MTTENTAVAASGAAAPAVVAQNPLSILSVAAINVDSLLTTPTANDGTVIAQALAKVFYPLKFGVLNVPNSLDVILNCTAQEAEEMLPLAALKTRIAVRKMASGALVRNIEGNEALDMILPQAIKNVNPILREFEALTHSIVSDCETLREQYAGEKAFYMAQSSGRRNINVDVAAVQTVLLQAISRLNIISSGFKGYEVLALVNHVSAIGSLIDDPSLSIPGIGNKTQLMNKLGFRLLPVHGQAHQALVALYDFIPLATSTDLTPDKCFDILIAAMNVKRALEQVDTFGGPTDGGVKKNW